MKKTTLLTAGILALATVMTTGLVLLPGPAQGSAPGTPPPPPTPQDNPCAGNDITQIPTTDDSEEVDSDIECEFYGPADIEGEVQQVPPDTDDFAP